MNYIENSFHFYETTESFEVHRKQGLIHPDSICFLKETAQIYTQESFFGICKERFERLEQLVLAHDAKIKNIMGIEGPSVNDGIVNNLADLVNFLDGFTDRDNLKEVIEGVRNNLEKQIESVSKELSDRVTALEDNINNDTENLQNTLNIINNKLDTVDIRLDNHDTALSAINTSLASHIREYNVLKTNYDNFKAYTESKFIAVDSSISSINTSITSLQRQFTELDEKFDDVENEVSSVESMLEDARKLVKEIEDRFGETLAAIEQFKRDIHNEIDDLKDLIGAPNGIAPLDSDAKVPSAYLPSYVDDVLEYATKAAFPVRGEEGKIYVALDDNLTYRWSGSTYVEISKSLGLGETSTTAYPGNKGKEVTDALKAHKLDYGNPHRVTKAQVGLDKVDNTRDIDKPISTAVQEALDNKVQIEPGKSLIDSEEAAKVIASNKKVEEFEESLQYEVDRATSVEAVISGALAQHKSDNTNPHGVTKSQVGLSNVDNTADIDKPVSAAVQNLVDTTKSDLESKINNGGSNFNSHVLDKSNPHEVTKAQVGLGNVDNTSDADKPVSTAQAEAIQEVQDDLDSHKSNVSNPHSVTKAQVGLGNVDNESKATMFTSPVFTGTPTAPTPASTVDNTQIATTAFVKSAINKQIAGNDAMIFKGVINSNSDLPATHEVGWTYKVGTAGTYAGESCEVGDMIMCITDGTVADNTHWSVIQTNIDGAVTGPVSSLSGNIPVFDGSTGKIIKDSGVSPSNIYTKSDANSAFIRKGTDTVDDSSLTFNTYDTKSNPIINIKNTGTSMYGQGISVYHNNDFVGKLNIDYTNKNLMWKNYPILDESNYSSTLDTRYVKRNDDSIPGSLQIRANTECPLTLEANDNYGHIYIPGSTPNKENHIYLYHDQTQFSRQVQAPDIKVQYDGTEAMIQVIHSVGRNAGIKLQSGEDPVWVIWTKHNSTTNSRLKFVCNYSPYGAHAEIWEDGTFIASKIVKREGTSSQYLKADGSTSTLSNASSSDAGLMSAEDKVNLDFLFGVNTVASVSNIPVNKRLVVASISSSATLSIASTPDAGKEIHIIVKNTGSSKITITLNSGLLSSFQDTSFDIEGGAFGEVNIISDGTNVYTRWA